MRVTDRIISPDDDLVTIVNEMPEGSTIELAGGIHVLKAELKPKDGVMIFSRLDHRSGAIVLCEENHHHAINGGDSVTIANIGLMGYKGTHKQKAWINPNGTMNGLRLLHCDISDVQYRAVAIAPHMRVYDCVFRDIGVLGVGYTNIASWDVELNNNQFTRIEGDQAGVLVEYGAMKLGNIRDSVVRNNLIHDCIEGIWFDGEPLANSQSNPYYENYGNHIMGNIIYGIEKSGIHLEVSHGQYVDHNFVKHCGGANAKWAWGAGILIIDSCDNTLRGNTVDCTHGGNGISIGKQDRSPYAYHNRVGYNAIYYGDNSHSGIYDADNQRIGFFKGHQYYAGGNAFTRNNHYVPVLNANRYGIEHKHVKWNDWWVRQQDLEGAEILYKDGELSVPEWSLNNDFVAPLPVPPIIVQPPSNKPIPVGTKFKFNGEIEVIES